MLLPSPTLGCLVYDVGAVYVGGDLQPGVRNVRSARECAVLCAETAGCKSFTWGRKRGVWTSEVCFMKRVVTPARRADDCCDSGLPCSAAPTQAPWGFAPGLDDES